MNAKGRATILDIAKRADASTATVSRVLNGTDYPVRPELKERILKAAKELNYTPNIFGKMLKSGKSSDIGVIIPSLTNPFYSQTVSGIERECRKRGYNPIFCSSYNDKEKENAYIDLMQQKCVEGILISTINEDHSCLRNLLNQNQNIVMFDQETEGLDCDNITFNFHESGKLCAEYLVSSGHEKIAFLTMPFTRRSRRSVFEGFQAALKVYGVPFSKSQLFVCTVNDAAYGEDGLDEFENGRVLAQMFAESGCKATAIAAINDITAFGVISWLAENRIRVPEDVSVIGFDNISISTMINPPLTTVNQPSYEMGRLAARMLIDKIDQGVKMSSRVLLQPSIIERGSVKQLK